mgnify:FL=1
MAREDYSNRTRETVHRNWLFDNTNVIVSGQNDQLRDTFIYNQSWWTKNSNCHNHYYKLQAGVSSGHSHAFPKDREELVLGLMNRLREGIGGQENHGVVPPASTDSFVNNNPYTTYAAWDDANYGSGHWDGYWGYRHIETQLDPWFGNYKPASNEDNNDDDCMNSNGVNTEDLWKVNGDAFLSSEFDEDGLPNPNYEPAIDYSQIKLWDPCTWSHADYVRKEMGQNENDHNPHAGAANAPDGDWCTEGGVGSFRYECGNPLVDCYGDFRLEDGANSFYYNPGPSGSCPGANWMRNQPPSLERTPFRPILLCDLRTTNNPAVPEGGFITTCKLILTVSKQSVAWPKKGFTAEVLNLVAGVNEDANWYSPTGISDNLLPHDSAGHTLGDWYDATARSSDGVNNGVTWGVGQHWLPDPIHKSIFPKETDSYRWNPPVGYPNPEYPEWDSDYATSVNNSYGINGETDGAISPYEISDQTWGHGDYNRPWNRACYLTGKSNPSDSYSTYEWGGIYSEQVLIGPAYDGEQSWEGIHSDNPLTNGLPPYRVWEPIPWWVECGWACGNAIQHPPVGSIDGTSPDTGYGVRAVGCSAGTWHARASEVEGLTGCGGAVDVTYGGFTHDVSPGGVGQPLPHYAYDGQNLNTNTFLSFGPGTHEYIPEWAPISSPNYKEFQIPKFTDSGFTGSYENLVNIEGSHGTGSTGQYNGRGITFSIELDQMARNAISKKDQKLDIIVKGEYKARPTGSTLDAVYESAGAMWVKTLEQGCHNCVDELYPKSTGFGNLPVQGFQGVAKAWKTDAAQIATNFFSVDSPAPNKVIPIHFRGMGSTVDWQSGNVGSMSYGLQTTQDPNKEEYILIPRGMQTIGGGYSNQDSFDRFNNVFRRMSSTDSVEILDSENYGFNGNTDGTYTPYKMEIAEGYTKVYVTGGSKLFPNMPVANRPETINDQSARFIGTHKINLDTEYYIETSPGYPAHFEDFYDNVSVGSDHSNQKAYPEFYSQDAFVEGGGGITGGGRDIIEVNIQGNNTHLNNGTYTIEEVYYMNQEHDIYIERLRVKEKVIDQSTENCLVKRVNHRPRFEVSFRSRHQYDRPGD